MPAADLVMFFSGGGTGGHLYPGVAVANAVVKRWPRTRVVFLGTPRALDKPVVTQAGYELIEQPVEPFPRGLAAGWRFVMGWWRSVRQVRRLMDQREPAAVLGLGGYAAAPAVYAAHKRGYPTAILNPDLIPGRANRHMASWADAVFCQWDESHGHLPEGAVCKTTGCPIREEFARADRAAGIERFELDPQRRTILVTGASQGARTLNEAFVAALKELDDFGGNWQVLHLSGPELAEETLESYRAAGPALPYRVVGFTSHMADAMAAADLVVCRAGASTLAELTALGRPSVLLPYPYHKDQHQRRNGEVLAMAGAARIVTDTTERERTAEALGRVLGELLGAPEGLEAMASTARRMGKPEAADAVARELGTLAGLDRNGEAR